MRSISRLAAMVVAALAALVLAVPAFAQGDEAMVRVAHLSSDAPNVDVYVNDEPVAALTNVPYGTVSPYLPLPSGTQNVKVYASGDTSSPVIEADVDLAGGQAYTVGAVGLVGDGSLTAQVYEDDISAPSEGNAKLRVIHASPDAGPVDVAPAGGDPLVSNLEFPDASPYAEVPADTYDLNVLAAGTDTVAIAVPGVTVQPETVYTAFAVGTAAAGNLSVIPVVDSANGMATMPDTGGTSPLVLAGAAMLALGAVGGLVGLHTLRRRTTA